MAAIKLGLTITALLEDTIRRHSVMCEDCLHFHRVSEPQPCGDTFVPMNRIECGVLDRGEVLDDERECRGVDAFFNSIEQEDTEEVVAVVDSLLERARGKALMKQPEPPEAS